MCYNSSQNAPFYTNFLKFFQGKFFWIPLAWLRLFGARQSGLSALSPSFLFSKLNMSGDELISLCMHYCHAKATFQEQRELTVKE